MDINECIDNDQWEAYSQGTLTASEWKRMQAHMAVCEICADIREGIDAMSDPKTLNQRMGEIHRQVDERLLPQKGRIIPLYIRWSAAAAILIVSGFLLFQVDLRLNTDASLAMVQPKPDTAINPVQNMQGIAELKAKKLPKVSPEKSYKAPQKKSTERSEVVAKEETPQMPQIPTITQTEEKVASVQDLITRKQESLEDVQQKDFTVVNTQKVFKNEMSKSKKSLTTYPSNYANTENNQSMNWSNRNLSAINDSLLYHLALAQYNRAQYDSSLMSLNPILKDSGFRFYTLSKNLQMKILEMRNNILQKDSADKK